MKRLILLFLLCSYTAVWGISAAFLGSGGSSLDVMGINTFESSDGYLDPPPDDDIYDETGNKVQNWVASQDNTSYISATIAKNGTQSLYHITTTGGGIVQKTYTEQSGDHWVDLWLATNDSAGSTGRFGISDGTLGESTNHGPYLRIEGNDIDCYYSLAWNNL